MGVSAVVVEVVTGYRGVEGEAAAESDGEEDKYGEAAAYVKLC